MTISELTLKTSAEIDEPVRRFEVFTGAGHWREWSAEDKGADRSGKLRAWCDGERRRPPHALSPQQLFTWRREIRKAAEAMPAFVPAVVTPEPVLAAEPSAASPRRKRRSRHHRRVAAIEIDVAGVKVTIENGASPATIAAVLGALKAGL